VKNRAVLRVAAAACMGPHWRRDHGVAGHGSQSREELTPPYCANDVTGHQIVWAGYYAFLVVVLIVVIWIVTPQSSPKWLFVLIGVAVWAGRMLLQVWRLRQERAKPPSGQDL
jgi:hypothetical protein